MRVEKENQFSSFSKLLTRIDATNLGDYQLKILKQEHDYLDRLRNQRIKIEELKQKYDLAQSQLNDHITENNQLKQLLQEKCTIIQNLQEQLKIEITKKQTLERSLQKQLDLDKNKSKLRTKQIEQQNQELKKIVRQKQLLVISMEEEFNQKFKRIKQVHHSDKKSLMIQFQNRLSQVKSKNTDNEVLQLRNLVSRQNKALKMQNQKFEDLNLKNQNLITQIQELKAQVQRKQAQVESYEQKVRELYDELETLSARMEKQDHNNKLKGQLEQIRRKMAQIQKGEIEKIQFIVNQLE